MDRKTVIEELRNEAVSFRDARNWKQFHSPKNLAMGLSIEAAELQELFLWKTDAQVTDFLKSDEGRKRLSEELADIFVYLLYLTEECGIDLSAATRDKIALNAAKYPVEKSYNSSKKYTEFTKD